MATTVYEMEIGLGVYIATPAVLLEQANLLREELSRAEHEFLLRFIFP